MSLRYRGGTVGVRGLIFTLDDLNVYYRQFNGLFAI
jgi:hypothetical protein